jgi:hypothetical protein
LVAVGLFDAELVGAGRVIRGAGVGRVIRGVGVADGVGAPAVPLGRGEGSGAGNVAGGCWPAGPC